MFTHMMVGTNDPAKAKAFYEPTMKALGYDAVSFGNHIAFNSGESSLVVGPPRDGNAATYSNGGTIGFKAKSTAEVDAFHAAGIANGGTCDGEPGIRENSPGKLYGAYLRDPDGNKLGAFAPNPGNAS